MILATSFKGNNGEFTAAPKPVSSFDNPVYALTGGKGLPRTSTTPSHNYDQEPDMTKEELAMIGRPLGEDDIVL